MERMTVCLLQFKRAGDFKKNVEKARSMLEGAGPADFALLGGEFSLAESKNIDPYPALSDMARSFNCNIIAPVNANLHRFPALKEKGFSSMHVFGRKGDVVAIQDKQHFYPREKPWFRPGTDVRIFEVDGIRIGLSRGRDILSAEYMRKLAGADVIFLSTMAVDDAMFNAAVAWTGENRCYVAMSSYIGRFVGMNFIGNAAVLGPAHKIMKRLGGEGTIKAELDIRPVRAGALCAHSTLS